MVKIVKLNAEDVRFPTSTESHGSDAMHTSPDYSAAYVTLVTSDSNLKGYGLAFTLGRGTELIVRATHLLEPFLLGKDVNSIFNNFREFWNKITNEHQLRWIGPQKGVIHLATAAVVNALWDLWAKMEGKPLWKLLCDMEPEKLVSTIDFSYITDLITEDEALGLLKKGLNQRKERDKELQRLFDLVVLESEQCARKKCMAISKLTPELRCYLATINLKRDNGKIQVSSINCLVSIVTTDEKCLEKYGYPAYTTSVGWIGYSCEKIQKLCREAIKQGWTRFKMKVGGNLEDDKTRAAIIRKEIGDSNLLMMDANQRWDVDVAITHMKQLAEFRPLWIEEPTSPDDILGHATIARALEPFVIGVATGEHCQNRVIFKQLLQAKAIRFCQIDSCRVGGVNENLAIILMAAKVNVPICPHAGGVGLCEMVQHLSIFDFIAVTGSTENRMIEYVDHLHEHFLDPVRIKDGHYLLPQVPGFSTQMKQDSVDRYSYPDGKLWKNQKIEPDIH